MDELYEFLKNFLPVSVLLTFPLVFVFMPIQYTTAANEFTIYRMQQFNFYGVSHGCRSSSFSLEAKSITTWKTSRHCVITRLKDLTYYRFLDISQQAGALLVMLPKDIHSLSNDEKANIVELEKTVLSQELTIPIYFILWDKVLQIIISNIDQLTSSGGGNRNKKDTAAEALYNSIFAMGYQAVVNAHKPIPLPNAQIAVLQGKLLAYGFQTNMSPTIVIVAHYDAQSIIPDLSLGADSNGSGVAILLELARLFSKLYSQVKTQPKYNLVFLLTGGGKFSYLGSKKWIEDQSELIDSSDDYNVLLQNVVFVMCLDTLATDKNIYIHVSKPPKNGTVVYRFVQVLTNVASSSSVNVELVHKKINLAEQMLAWEHERYSMKRIPAFTLSALQSHKDWRRDTIFDNAESLNVNNLYVNSKIIAESLARLMYDFQDSNVLTTHKIELESLKALTEFLSAHPRSQQLLSDKDNTLVTSLYYLMNKYLQCNITYMHAEKNDPEFVFYDVSKSTVHIYSVKPAVFDLVLTCMIGAYLALVYFTIQKFPLLYSSVMATISYNRKKVN